MSYLVQIALTCWKWLSRGGLNAVLRWLFQPGRIKILVAALGLLYGAYLIHQVQQARQERDALTEALAASQGEVDLLRTAREADASALATASAAKAVITSQERISVERTKSAIAANPRWANEPIPPDVVDSLRY